MENLSLSLGMLVVFPTFNVRVVYSGIIQIISPHICKRRRFNYVGEMWKNKMTTALDATGKTRQLLPRRVEKTQRVVWTHH